jgi:polar amino acid transport system substrate-binding protein
MTIALREMLHVGASLLVAAALGCATATDAEEQTGASVAPKGELRVAVITSMPVLVTRNLEGKLTGVTVDLANALASKLGIPVRIVPYENIVHYNQSIGRDEWDVGFAPRDLSRTGQLAFSDPILEVDNSYVARSGIMLSTPDEVDRPGIKVAVAQGSAIDGFLTRTLKKAQIVRLVSGFDAAREALLFGRVDVYADSTQIAYRLMAEVPGAKVLVAPLNVVQISIAIPKSNSAALPIVNDFIHESKRDGVIAEAIKHADLRGARPGR